MAKLASIEFQWDEKGDTKPIFQNLAKLDRSAETEVINFCAPALLSLQLSTMIRLYGVRTIRGIYKVLQGDRNPLPIGTDLVSAHLDINSGDNRIFITFHPKIKFLSRYAEEGVSSLVINYAQHVLEKEISVYTDLVEAALLTLVIEYFDDTYKAENYFSPVGDDHRLAPEVRKHFSAVSACLYNHWKGDTFLISPEEYQKRLEKYRWKLSGN